MQAAQLRYVIKFVADMDKAVKFRRDMLGPKVKFESPGWSEFATGKRYPRNLNPTQQVGWLAPLWYFQP
jgi:catechol 2,3-dioxygenase-like lactoylglutathione lyase family enzyme